MTLLFFFRRRGSSRRESGLSKMLGSMTRLFAKNFARSTDIIFLKTLTGGGAGGPDAIKEDSKASEVGMVLEVERPRPSSYFVIAGYYAAAMSSVVSVPRGERVSRAPFPSFKMGRELNTYTRCKLANTNYKQALAQVTVRSRVARRFACFPEEAVTSRSRGIYLEFSTN